jgi:SAM-dependent methyltransferase
MFYNVFMELKETIWKAIGANLFKKRSLILARMLTELQKELDCFHQYQTSEPLLLDIGCGRGEFTKEISKVFDITAVGINLNKHQVHDEKSNFLVADGCMLPFKSQAFTLICAFSIIEHITQSRRQDFYKEVSNVLDDNGIFLVQLPNRYFPIEQHSFLPFIGYLPQKLHSIFYHSYVSVPSKDDALKELRKSGYLIVSVVAYRMPVSMLYKALSGIIPFGFVIIARKPLNLNTKVCNDRIISKNFCSVIE